MAGRPRTFDRDTALEQALDAFWRDGYAGTSVAGLTERMGIRPPSLYAAFGDKGHLFREAADLYLERFRQGVEADLDAPTAREGIATLMRDAARAHTEPGTPPGCFVLHEPRLAPEREWLRAEIGERIAQGQRDGDVSDAVDADQLAAFFDAVLTGMSARACDGATRDELDVTAELSLAALPAT